MVCGYIKDTWMDQFGWVFRVWKMNCTVQCALQFQILNNGSTAITTFPGIVFCFLQFRMKFRP